MKPLFKKYADKIKTDTLGERDIIMLRSHLNGSRDSFDTGELCALHDLVEEHKPRVTSDQSKKGIAWLRGQWHTPKGKVRKNNPFGYHEQHVLENFSHFKLVGFFDTHTTAYRSNYLPQYRVIATGGASFEYVPWAGDWPTNKTVYIVE